ncbi:MAG: hypothetical protein ACOCSR_05710, partial [Wenzhouxiangella sp.]
RKTGSAIVKRSTCITDGTRRTKVLKDGESDTGITDNRRGAGSAAEMAARVAGSGAGFRNSTHNS